MATLYGFSSYVANMTAKYVFKNTSGETRFFGFVGPTGKEMTSNEVVVQAETDLEFYGPTTRKAITDAMTAGTIKFGCDGVTFYAFKADNGAYSTTIVMPKAGKIVGMYVNNRLGTTGTNAEAFLRGTTNSCLSGTLTLPTAAVGAAEYALSATAAYTVCEAGDPLVLRLSADPTSGHTSVLICAVAHHN